MDQSATGNLPQPDLKAAALMWRDYCTARGHCLDATYTVEYFGDHPALADALLHEVTHGQKRATSSLENEYTQSGAGLPVPGSHWIACDSSGTPRIIIRTIEVQLLPFDEVEERFAWDEGEEDRTLANWRTEHQKYWARTQHAAGLHWGPETTRNPGYRVVCERFEITWPPATPAARESCPQRK